MTSLCPISLEPINVGVILSDGFTYDKNSISKLLGVDKLEYNVGYEKLTKSPYTGEDLICNKIYINIKINSGGGKYYKRPYVDNTGYTHEYDDLVKNIESIISNRNTCYYRNFDYPESSQDQHYYIFPNKSLMIMNNISIRKDDTSQMFILPKMSDIILKPIIYSMEIRDLFTKKFDSNLIEKLKELYKKHEIEINENDGYFQTIVYRDIDLSNVVINATRKSDIFYNCNLSGAVIMSDAPRTQFNYCDLSNTIFINGNLIGEELSFYKSNMEGCKFTENVKIEKGISWILCKTSDEIVEEIKRRGGYNVTIGTI